MDDDLGVAGRLELVAARDEALAQLAIIVDLAVENDGVAAGLVGDGLLAAAEIDDREAPHAERAAVIEELAVVVGAAMEDGTIHRGERAADRFRRAEVVGRRDESVNATHGLASDQR